MLSEHRQVDDEHSKIDVFSKGNRSLKPHQPGMAKTGEVHKASWVAPTGEQDLPLPRSPFILGCLGQLISITTGVVLFGTVQ